ncbi:MAG TPA: VOC family protein [Thermoanaerobaculia bacterium]|nr:VOC family protein [Thermoanaerobaculia bacterium]
MEIRQLRVVVRAKNFDATCRFYGEVLALPRLQNWEREDGRAALFQAGSGVIEVLGRPAGVERKQRDEAFDYLGPHHKLVLVLEVPSAEKAYEELLFRDRNIPGGLRRDADGGLIFDTHDPDGVRIIFKQQEA